MYCVPLITADIRFLPRSEGGRLHVPFDSVGEYMPHVVVEGADPEDPGARLGVRFVGVSVPDPTEHHGRFWMHPLYHPQMDYSPVQPGVGFGVYEGLRIVAHGIVVERIN